MLYVHHAEAQREATVVDACAVLLAALPPFSTKSGCNLLHKPALTELSHASA